MWNHLPEVEFSILDFFEVEAPCLSPVPLLVVGLHEWPAIIVSVVGWLLSEVSVIKQQYFCNGEIHAINVNFFESYWKFDLCHDDVFFLGLDFPQQVEPG